MALPREYRSPFADISPGVVGMEDCESLFTLSQNKKMVAEEYSARRFLSIEQSLGHGDLDNINWLPGLANAADEMTKVRSDMLPLPPPLESRAFQPRFLGPLWCVSSNGRAERQIWGSPSRIAFAHLLCLLPLLENSFFALVSGPPVGSHCSLPFLPLPSPSLSGFIQWINALGICLNEVWTV